MSTVSSPGSTARRAERLLRWGCCALLAAAAGAPAARAADAPLAPSLTVDQAFAPSTSGIARDGGAGTGTEIPGGLTTYGDRIYTTGESNGEVAVIARAANGAYDTTFGGGDGRVDIAVGTGKDVGMSIVALPDGRLRILAEYDADATSSTNQDIAIIGLKPDGTPDPTFGGGDGKELFPVGPVDEEATRLVADATGRLAITGWKKDTNGKEDLFVSIRKPDGSPETAFGPNGIRTLDRGGSLKNDRGIDVVWSKDGGVVVMVQVATNADTNVNDYIAVLHAFTATGAADTSFSGDGDLELGVGQPSTIPGGLLAYGGRLWVTGSTKVGTDTDAFLARVEADGTGLVSRRFDMRGSQIAANQVVVSGGGDLDVLPGDVPALVIVGSTTYNSRTFWSAAVFNNFGGDLAQAGFGDVLIPTDEYGALLGVQAMPGALAVTGSLLNVNGNFDTSFGTLRLLVDADKQCDLGIDVPAPLEARFNGNAPLPVTLSVTNAGKRPCSGQVTVPDGYTLQMGGQQGALSTGIVGPGATWTSSGALLSYSGARRREDTIAVRVAAAGDTTTANNSKLVHVLFAWCDVTLTRLTAGLLLPSEGARRFEFEVRNRGSARCRRVQLAAEGGLRTAGTPNRYAVASGRSVTDAVAARLAAPAKPGTKVPVTFRVRAAGDLDAGNDVVRGTGTVVGVGDSDIRRAGRGGVAGSARGGRGNLSARQRAVKAVDVAIRRLGSGCRWLVSKRSATFRKGSGSCRPARWLRARGTTAWRLDLARSLPPGTYEALSRARIRAGRIREARFTKADRTRVRFTVR